MQKIIITLFMACAAIPATASERRYSVTDFDRIQVDGPYKVTVVMNGRSSARATGSVGDLDRVAVDVVGKTLRIRASQSSWGGFPDDRQQPIAIEVTAATLNRAGIYGAGTLLIDKAKGLRLDLDLAGSGSIGIDKVDADALNVSLLGSGQIALAGKVKTLHAEIHGSGNLAAEGLSVSDAQIVADTAGSVKLAVIRSAKVTSTGAGDVDIIGSAACTVSSRGSGRVRCRK